MRRLAGAILWLITGVALGAGLYNAVQHIFQLSSILILLITSVPAFLTGGLESYKKGLEVRKLHLEIAELSRKAKREQEAANLVRKVSHDLPERFKTPYGERERGFYRLIQEQERISRLRFDIDSSE